jgi:hypothetical protein
VTAIVAGAVEIVGLLGNELETDALVPGVSPTV